MPIRRRQKKRNAGPRQKQKQPHAVINPLVNPGNPPHRHQTRPKADPTRTHHRMVTVAQSSPSSSSALSPQKTATVMLGVKARHAAYVMSQYWEQPIDHIDWEARAARLLIEAVCDIAGTPPFEHIRG